MIVEVESQDPQRTTMSGSHESLFQIFWKHNNDILWCNHTLQSWKSYILIGLSVRGWHFLRGYKHNSFVAFFSGCRLANGIFSLFPFFSVSGQFGESKIISAVTLLLFSSFYLNDVIVYSASEVFLHREFWVSPLPASSIKVMVAISIFEVKMRLYRYWLYYNSNLHKQIKSWLPCNSSGNQ